MTTATAWQCMAVGPAAAELVAELQNRCLPEIGAEAWSAEGVRDMLAVSGTVGCLASEAESPAGVALGRQVADEFELLFLGVLAEHRRRGCGAQLLNWQLAQAKNHSAARCYLEVAEGNRGARALYQNAGFQRVGVRLGYYRDSSGLQHDALLLCKTVR